MSSAGWMRSIKMPAISQYIALYRTHFFIVLCSEMWWNRVQQIEYIKNDMLESGAKNIRMFPSAHMSMAFVFELLLVLNFYFVLFALWLARFSSFLPLCILFYSSWKTETGNELMEYFDDVQPKKNCNSRTTAVYTRSTYARRLRALLAKWLRSKMNEKSGKIIKRI